MDISTITAVPAIVVICMALAQVFKSFTPESWNKHIPAICCILGALLGTLSFAMGWGDIHAETPLMAIAMGAVSGWAATGIHQTGKQYMDNRTEEKDAEKRD